MEPPMTDTLALSAHTRNERRTKRRMEQEVRVNGTLDVGPAMNAARSGEWNTMAVRPESLEGSPQ